MAVIVANEPIDNIDGEVIKLGDFIMIKFLELIIILFRFIPPINSSHPWSMVFNNFCPVVIGRVIGI
jgi:hypothetical protein